MAEAEIEWTQDALEQLDGILDYIAADGGDSASIAKRIYAAVQRLSSFPESAPFHAATLRRLVVRRLPISCYYLYEGGMVSILYVRHDHQQPLD